MPYMRTDKVLALQGSAQHMQVDLRHAREGQIEAMQHNHASL